MELLYRALLDTSEIFTGLDKIEARLKNVNISALQLKINGLKEAQDQVKILQEELNKLSVPRAIPQPRELPPKPPVVDPVATSRIQEQIQSQIQGLNAVSKSAEASAAVFGSSQAQERFAALQTADAVKSVQFAMTRVRTEFDKAHGQAQSWQEQRDAVLAYQKGINGVTESVQQLNTRIGLTLTQARTLSRLEGEIARQQATLEGKVNPLGLSGNVANAIRAAGLAGQQQAGGSLGAASAESAKAADAALSHLKTTLDAGRISLVDYRIALGGLDAALKEDIGATELEIKALTELGALNAVESARLAELITQQKAYAQSIILTADAQKAAAAAAKEASVAGQLNRGLGAGGLNGAALGLSFASPVLGLAATAASFGPQTVAIAGVGLAVAGTTKLFLDGANKAALFQQQLGQINALSHVGSAAINDYGKYVKQIGQDLGITTTDLNEFGRQAVLVGLDSGPGLKTFTKGMSELKVILRDVHGETPGLEEVGTETVKILRSMGQSSEEVNTHFGSTVNALVALKTQFGVAIPDVTALATYFSSYASTIGLTTDQILAFSASLVSVGARAQGSGSQLTKFFEKAAAAGASGGAPLKAFAFALGLTAEETQKLLKADPARFLQQFAERLATLHDRGIDSSIILKSLGLDSNQAARAFNELSVASVNTQRALDIAKKGLQDTGLSARIAAEATSSYPDQLKKLGVAFDNLKIGLGVEIVPALRGFVQGLTNVVTGIDGLVNDGDKVKSFFSEVGRDAFSAFVGVTALALSIESVRVRLLTLAGAAVEKVFLAIFDGAVAAEGAVAGLSAASISLVGPIALLAAGLAIYVGKTVSDTEAIYKGISDAEQASQDAVDARIEGFRKSGTEIDKVKAKILLAQKQLAQAEQGSLTGADLLGNRTYTVDPEEVKRAQERIAGLRAELTTLNTEQSRHVAIGKVDTQTTKAVSEVYGTLSDKLVDLNGKYTEVKTTGFQSQLASARKELESFNKEVDKALKLGDEGKKGGITGDEAKRLRDRAQAVAQRDLTDITAQQVTADKDAATSRETQIQQARLAVIKDARAKREAEYQNEVTTLQATYGKSIREALTNARTPGLDSASRAQLLRDAGVVQQQLAKAEAAALVKRNQDLSDLDDARAKKLRDAGTQSLALLATESDARTKILTGERDQALQLAGSSVTGRLAAEERYGPALEQQQEAARQLQLRAEQAKLRNELADALKAADDQGTATAGLKLAAQQDFNTKSRTLDSLYTTDINKFRLDAEKTLADARLAVFQAALDKELAGLKELEGKRLALEESSLKARRAAALAVGDIGQVAALDKGIKLLEGVKSDNLKTFNQELKKSTTSAADLRTQLDNIASGPLEKALKGAAATFNSVLKTAQDNVKTLRVEFDKLTPDQKLGAPGAAFQSRLAEQSRIILAANQGRNDALLNAQQDYDRKLADKATDANTKIAKTEFDGGKITEAVYDRQLDLARTYYAGRLKVAEKGSAEEQAATQKLDDLQGERDRARTATLAKQADARALTREELTSQLELAKTEAERVSTRAQLVSGDAVRLASVESELVTLRATGGKIEDIAKLERERLKLRGDLNTAVNEAKQREADTLTFNREELNGQLTLARTEAQRAQARGELLAFDQGTLATLNARLAAETQLGAPVEKIRALKSQILTLETGINTQLDEQRQRMETLIASQLKLNAAQQSRQAALARSNAEIQTSKEGALGVTLGELQDVARRLDAAKAQGKSEAEVNDLLSEQAQKQVAVFQAQRDAARFGIEVSQQQLDLTDARLRAQAQITGSANDAVDTARLDLDVTRLQIQNLNDQLAHAAERQLTEGEVNALLVKRLGLLGTEADQLRKVTEAEHQRALLVEAVQRGGEALSREEAVQVTGVDAATQSLTLARSSLSTATREYMRAQADLNREQSTTNLQRFQTAQDTLTASLSAQRQAVQGLATAYRDQLSSLDAVVAATDKLRAVAPPGVTARTDGQEFERFAAIQERRDAALAAVQDAIKRGDQKIIASTVTELAAQQDRYNKQADLLDKRGLQPTRQGDAPVLEVLRQLEGLTNTYDAAAAELATRAQAADQEAKAATTLDGVVGKLPDVFTTGARQISVAADALRAALSTQIQSAPPVIAPAQPAPVILPPVQETQAQKDQNAYQQVASLQGLYAAKVRDANGNLVYDASKKFSAELLDIGPKLAAAFATAYPQSGAGALMPSASQAPRGGDTITYQIENNIYPAPGQQLGLDDVTQAVNRGIDERIGAAKRDKAWKAGC
ncbi:hypothetical protein Q0M94_11905 [Deinococcus radiomollis]|uniref:hypothetical protein n=1 Tax=Deinococcus radiomollis TaxID=468916 RepID=UPI003891BCF6